MKHTSEWRSAFGATRAATGPGWAHSTHKNWALYGATSPDEWPQHIVEKRPPIGRVGRGPRLAAARQGRLKINSRYVFPIDGGKISRDELQMQRPPNRVQPHIVTIRQTAEQ